MSSLLVGYGLGLFVAAQIGPVSLLIVRSVVRGNFRIVLGFVGAAVLVAIGLRSMWIGFRARFGLETAEEVGTPRRAFATAFAATALNPLTIALWTAAAPAAVSGATSSIGTAALLVGVGLGALTWYTCFAGAISLARRRIGPRMLAAIDIGAGAGILGFGAYLGYRAARS